MTQAAIETDHRALELERSWKILRFCLVDFLLMALLMIFHELKRSPSFLSITDRHMIFS